MVNDEVKKEDTSTNTASNSVTAPITDISKNTVIILVILTVVISVVGTFVVMFEMNNIKTVAEAPRPASANVQLNILPIGGESKSPNALSETTGRVSLNILPIK